MRYMMTLYEQHEREESARRLREEERRTMEEALQRPPAKLPRLQIDIAVQADGTTTSARLHAPMPSADATTTVSLTLKENTTATSTTNPPEADGNNLMQKPTSSSPTTTTSDCLARLRTRLAGVNPGSGAG